MAWNGLVLTVDGQNALNAAQLANRMSIKSVVVGDGQPPANFRTLKGLVHQLYGITDLKTDTGENGKCTIIVDIPEVEYDYYFREIGIIVTTDEGEKLYAYDNCTDDAQYIVSTTGVETTRKRIRLTINVSDVANITVSNPGILYVGYDDYEQTVGRLEEAIAATAEEAAEALDAHVKDMDNPHHVTKSHVGLGNVDNTSDTKKPVSEAQQAAIDAVKKLLNDAFNSHAGDKSNPHRVTKAQVGLGNADDTADINKPISTAQQAALDALYQQLTAYTNQKIADLINGAPSSLDTLKEVADAIAAHKTIMDALDAAIGKKASAAEFTSHAQDTTKHVTAAQQASWTGKLAPTGDASNVISTFSQASSRANLTSKEKLSVSLGKIMKWFADLANGAASSLLGANLTANRALVANTGGKVAASAVTATELGYLAGVTSGIQGQFNELNTHINGFEGVVLPLTGSDDQLSDQIYAKWGTLPNKRGCIYVSNGTTIYAGTYVKYDNYNGSITITSANGDFIIWRIYSGVHAMWRNSFAHLQNFIVVKDFSTPVTVPANGLASGSFNWTIPNGYIVGAAHIRVVDDLYFAEYTSINTGSFKVKSYNSVKKDRTVQGTLLLVKSS